MGCSKQYEAFKPVGNMAGVARPGSYLPMSPRKAAGVKDGPGLATGVFRLRPGTSGSRFLSQKPKWPRLPNRLEPGNRIGKKRNILELWHLVCPIRAAGAGRGEGGGIGRIGWFKRRGGSRDQSREKQNYFAKCAPGLPAGLFARKTPAMRQTA
ncbi:hypothetical protein DVDV_1841 [Desulfovibrio sp. DV]|nr:hypothetical protein DVDV_1841 [Desulfovibrio sp. DV]